jgi:hypothetical protein
MQPGTKHTACQGGSGLRLPAGPGPARPASRVPSRFRRSCPDPAAAGGAPAIRKIGATLTILYRPVARRVVRPGGVQGSAKSPVTTSANGWGPSGTAKERTVTV